MVSQLGIRPRLTVRALLELAHIMVGATLVTIMDVLNALLHFIVGCLCACVGYNHSHLEPQTTRPRLASSHVATESSLA